MRISSLGRAERGIMRKSRLFRLRVGRRHNEAQSLGTCYNLQLSVVFIDKLAKKIPGRRSFYWLAKIIVS